MTKSNCVDLTNANTQRHVPGEDPMHHDRARGVAVSGGGEDAAMTDIIPINSIVSTKSGEVQTV